MERTTDMKTLALTILAAGFAAAQIPDAPGVTVELNGSVLLHRSSITYPEVARSKSIHGQVTAEVTLDAAGNVSDARILSGPDELRRPVLQSALGWHFANPTAGAQRQVTVRFAMPAGQAEQERLRTTAYVEEMRAKATEQVKQMEA